MRFAVFCLFFLGLVLFLINLHEAKKPARLKIGNYEPVKYKPNLGKRRSKIWNKVKKRPKFGKTSKDSRWKNASSRKTKSKKNARRRRKQKLKKHHSKMRTKENIEYSKNKKLRRKNKKGRKINNQKTKNVNRRNWKKNRKGKKRFVLPPSDAERSRQCIYAVAGELEMISRHLKEKGRQASEMEDKLRRLNQQDGGEHRSEEEESLMKEYLSLLNERNQLTRREYHLQLEQNTCQRERQYKQVSQELYQLITMEAWEKTEKHLNRIQHLRDEQAEIIEERHALELQKMDNEQVTKFDEVTGRDALAQVKEGSLMCKKDKNCAIQ